MMTISSNCIDDDGFSTPDYPTPVIIVDLGEPELERSPFDGPRAAKQKTSPSLVYSPTNQPTVAGRKQARWCTGYGPKLRY
jgi:hypothetical protein